MQTFATKSSLAAQLSNGATVRGCYGMGALFRSRVQRQLAPAIRRGCYPTHTRAARVEKSESEWKSEVICSELPFLSLDNVTHP